MGLPAFRYDDFEESNQQAHVFRDMASLDDWASGFYNYDPTPREPTRVQNAFVRFVHREGENGQSNPAAPFRVTIEFYGEGLDSEVLACVTGSRTLCGYGTTEKSALDDLIDGLVGDLESLSSSEPNDLTRDAREHLELIRSLIQYP